MKRMFVLVTLIATVVATSMAIVPAQAAQAENKAFCDATWKINGLFNTLPDEPTDAQIAKIQKKLNALLDQAEADVPAEIEPQVTAAAATLRAGIEAAFEDPTLEENGNAIDAWTTDNCGYEVVEVHATEYHFDGIPKTLNAGRTVFVLVNDGAELHEIGVIRIKTKTPLKVLLANEKRADKEVEFVGGGFAVQGATGYANVDLKKPGRYAAACFVPVGSVDPNAEVDGPPHAAEGMVQEFKVKS